MTTTDLEPGDFVQHPERKCHGLVHRRFARNDVGVVYADKDRDGITSYTYDLTGWERVETCTTEAVRILEDYQQIVSKSTGVIVRDAVVMMTPTAYEAYRGHETVRPGHVQVRVDDLHLDDWGGEDSTEWTTNTRVAVRAANALAAQRAESAPPADEPETVGDGCACWVTPEHMWTTYGSAVEPGSQVENNPRCPKHGEKPTSATVTLYCPDCGGAENVTVVMLGKQSNGERWFDLREFHAHTCQPVQPDEPTEFGARVTVTLPDGTREKWLRSKVGTNEAWRAENGSEIGWFIATTWDNVIERGTVTLGWDE